MSRGLRHGRFVATLERFADGCDRYYARHATTGRCRRYGLLQQGYETASLALEAMAAAERMAKDSDPTEEITQDAPRGGGDITEKVENPYA